MTVLQSLEGYYARMAERGEAEPTGFSREKISYRILLSDDGDVAEVVPLFETVGKKRVPRMLNVPAAVKRTAGILPNLIWDKTAYVLGRTAGEGRRTAEEHAAFKAANLAFIGNSDDAGLTALRHFLQTWTPGRFDAAPFDATMLDANLVFALDGDGRDLHERPAVQAMLTGRAGRGIAEQVCLVTGQPAAPTRLHPVIKGVWDSQSSGAALVSFNLDAFTSYGKEQGDNAPTSEAAAFRYGAALNRMLDKGRRTRLPRPVGDASVVFWADTSPLVDEAAASAAEAAVMRLAEPPNDAGEAAKLRDTLDLLAEGRPVAEAMPGIAPATRFHILGLAPNAARLSVRFWLDGTFELFARRIAAHFEAVQIEPAPWRGKPPSVNRLLVKTTALQEKFENIPDALAGEVMRAVFSGTPYPRTWLAAVVIRLRAGDGPGGGWHAAAIRACLSRQWDDPGRSPLSGHAAAKDCLFRPSLKECPPVSLDPDYDNQAYQLGRLFAVLEAAQYAALGRVNASIADRYYGAASATPARVFGALLRGARTHVSTANKRGHGRWLERRLDEIVARLPPELARTLKLEDQGRFAVGYYHERAHRPAKPEGETTQHENNQDEGN